MALANLLCILFLLFSFSVFSSDSQRLHHVEVSALRRIAKALGKSNWDFTIDPCTGGGNWTVPDADKGFESAVVCDCSFVELSSNDTTSFCHITQLFIKGENLTGTLPLQIGRLQYLQELDLSRNIINGTVPSYWSVLPLVGLSLMGNRLSGPFPEALTQILTLKNLSIEGNRFSGPIPDEIGNLVNLESLTVSANEFSGELPSALFKLANLTDLRISGNNFSGKIPDAIRNLTKLKKLHIQGSSMEGPIPPVISQLANLTDLRITDLRGGSMLPDLSGMKSLRTLMLRNCSLHGSIPAYIGNMKTLKYLDLSFNKLTGEIPSTFSNLGKVDFIYLTSNMLTGTIPQWIFKRNKNVDISYNTFTMDSSNPTQCLQGSVNMVESYSPAANISALPSCLKRNFPCNDNGKYRYSLHVNCGGKGMVVNGTKYEQDTEARGASMFFLGSGWAFSSTGNFMDNDVDADNYIASNTSALSMPHSELYTKARLSPIALKYYGLCMMNGNYTVKLHFAEITFTNDDTFASLGKRVFNVYIQGKLVLEDFNIVNAAGGPGKAIIKTFTAPITQNTLDIQFYWAGKGTTGIPNRGTYGPLVSAISVTPNFEIPPETNHRGNLRAAIIVWSSSLVVLSILVALCICLKRRLEGRKSLYGGRKCVPLNSDIFI